MFGIRTVYHYIRKDIIMRVPTDFPKTEPALTLVQQVIQALESKIHDGDLQPGDRLPAEGVLGEQLGVSRTVVRGQWRT